MNRRFVRPRPRQRHRARRHPAVGIVSIALLALAGALALSCASSGPGPPGVRPPVGGGHTPVIFVPGVTGTKLVDKRDGQVIWGISKNLLFPRDRGYQLALPLPGAAAGASDTGEPAEHPQLHYETPEPLWQLPLLPGFTKMIYRPLLEGFEEAGYRLGELSAPELGDDLFFFNYDWRYGNMESVRRLDDQLEALSEALGGAEIDLVCQSNAAKICRWLAKYGTLDPNGAEAGESWQRGYRVRKLVLVGASNNGALRVLQLLLQGRSYVPLFGRWMQPETFFTIRPLFEDLPADRRDLFFDETGKVLTVDLFDAKNWLEYGWSIFGPSARERLAAEPRADLFGTREDQFAYLEETLEQARRIQLLLAEDSAHFERGLRYYRLENDSLPTIDRALLTRDGDDWKTHFLGDRPVNRDPVLRKLASAIGDGHAVLASQRGLSPQENAAMADTRMVSGGHFEAIIEPDGLEAMLAFLADEDF